jgi:hypothetical protein
VRVLKTRWFDRFAKKQNIPDSALHETIERARNGQIDADLGGGLLKQRIPRNGAGRRGGFRVVIICRFEERAFFVYGFSKNDRDNITKSETEGFRKLRVLLDISDEQLEAMLKEQKLMEAL